MFIMCYILYMATATLSNGEYRVVLKPDPVSIKITTDQQIGNLRFIEFVANQIRYSVIVSSLRGFDSKIHRVLNTEKESFLIQVPVFGKSFIADSSTTESKIQSQLHCSVQEARLFKELLLII